jgi:hypothetical protein
MDASFFFFTGLIAFPCSIVFFRIADGISGNKIGLIVSLCGCVVLLLSAGGLYLYGHLSDQYLDTLQTANGEMVGQNYIDDSVTRTRNGVATGTSDTYTLIYRYTANGVSYTESGKTTLDPGGMTVIPVYYNPQNPQESILDLYRHKSDDESKYMLAAACIITAFFSSLGAWRGYARG